MPLSNRIALPHTATWPVSRSTRSMRSSSSGVSESETSDAMRSPTARSSRAASDDPISSTRPTNIPPLPVTGLCCLPRSRTVSTMPAAIAAASPPHASDICLNDAASRLSSSTSHRISLSPATGALSIFHALCGRAPCGAMTARRARGSPPASCQRLDRQPAAFERRREHDRGARPRDAGDAFEAGQEIVEVVGRTGGNFE